MDWKKIVTSPWMATFGVLDIIWGLTNDMIPEEGALNFLIASEKITGMAMGVGIVLLFLFVLIKLSHWVGEERTLGEAIKGMKMSSVLQELLEQIKQDLFVVFIDGIRIFIVIVPIMVVIFVLVVIGVKFWALVDGIL